MLTFIFARVSLITYALLSTCSNSFPRLHSTYFTAFFISHAWYIYSTDLRPTERQIIPAHTLEYTGGCQGQWSETDETEAVSLLPQTPTASHRRWGTYMRVLRLTQVEWSIHDRWRICIVLPVLLTLFVDHLKLSSHLVLSPLSTLFPLRAII